MFFQFLGVSCKHKTHIILMIHIVWKVTENVYDFYTIICRLERIGDVIHENLKTIFITFLNNPVLFKQILKK